MLQLCTQGSDCSGPKRTRGPDACFAQLMAAAGVLLTVLICQPYLDW